MHPANTAHDSNDSTSSKTAAPPSKTTEGTSPSSSTSSSTTSFTTEDYLSPFSAVDPAMRLTSKGASSPATPSTAENNTKPAAASTSSQPAEASTSSDSGSVAGEDSDKWGEVLATKHTLTSLYLQRFKVEEVKQRDWEAKRREKDLAEVVQAGARLAIPAETIRANLGQLEGLVPGLIINLDRMKASDWAKLLRNVDEVVAVIIALRGHYPKVDIGGLIQRRPRLLLATRQSVDDDAAQVKALLGSKVHDVGPIIEAVPELLNPQQLATSLANLASWFPGQDPFELLQQNPNILEAPNVEADPTYGSQVYAEPPPGHDLPLTPA